MVTIASALIANVVPARAETQAHDLRDGAHTIVRGAGSLVSDAGDVNGDGTPDFIMVDNRAEFPSAYVAFGSRQQTSSHVKGLGERGFRITGAYRFERWDYSASGAGDVNGDGLDDVIVGAPQAFNDRTELSGVAYVVFGKTSSEPVDLAEFNSNTHGDAGFRIQGGEGGSDAGSDVASAGDIDGDGLGDVVVGAVAEGAVYVVHGKTSPEPVDLLLFDMGLQGDGGFRIDTIVPDYTDQYSVAGGGDVNGDEIPDVMVGVFKHEGSVGDVYAIFGKSDPAPVDTRDLGAAGFRIHGPYPGSTVGWSLAFAGDVNADGIDDLIVGAAGLYFNWPGEAFVVFGKNSNASIELADLGRRGFRIRGPRGSATGAAVAGLGDVNRDGKDDVVIGAPFAAYNNRYGSGSAFVVFGKSGPGRVPLWDLGSTGFRVDGAESFRRPCRSGEGRHCDGDNAGWTVAGPGDVTGDGRPDVLVAAPNADPDDNGSVYLISGRRMLP